MSASPLLVVDAANVIGSVPDGWWRDRAGAVRRLRDALAGVAKTGLPESDSGSSAPGVAPPVDVVLIVEGAAKGVPSSSSVRVVNAPGSGDDTIVDIVRAAAAEDGLHRPIVVATSDRALRDRVTALGAQVLGPRRLPYPS